MHRQNDKNESWKCFNDNFIFCAENNNHRTIFWSFSIRVFLPSHSKSIPGLVSGFRACQLQHWDDIVGECFLPTYLFIFFPFSLLLMMLIWWTRLNAFLWPASKSSFTLKTMPIDLYCECLSVDITSFPLRFQILFRPPFGYISYTYTPSTTTTPIDLLLVGKKFILRSQ